MVIKRNDFIAMIMLGLFISGCARQPDESQIVARINNYKVTIDDFKQEAAMNIPGASKDDILQDIIIKELLLEQAQKMHLDKNKSFMKEIENYWKQALLKRIIEKKGNEFLTRVKVTDIEAKDAYSRMKEENEGDIESYEQIAGQIKDKLKIEKAQVLLDLWISDLEKGARIKKYNNILNEINLKKTNSQKGGQNAQ